MSIAEREIPLITETAAPLYLDGPNRRVTIELGKLLSNSQVTTGREPEIANWARETLGVLRQQPGVYAEYGCVDIVRGLAEIPHPDTQLVVVFALNDRAELVSSAAKRALLDPRRYIYEETIDSLLRRNPQTRDLAFAIITHNPAGGVLPDRSVVLPKVADFLADIIQPQKYNHDFGPERKRAIVASILYERTNGDLSNLPRHRYNNGLYQRARDLLKYYLNEQVIRFLSEKETFADLVNRTVLINFQAARTARNIEEMSLAFPIESEPEELKALRRLAGADNPPETVRKYQALVALLKRQARDHLSSQVAEEIAREKEQQEKLRMAMEEANKVRQTELERALAREAQVRREELQTELVLVKAAQRWFPHLSP